MCDDKPLSLHTKPKIMAKINFTAEHQARLQQLAGEALFAGTTFKGSLGSEMSIFDLIHNTNVQTLTRYHGNIRKEISEIENLDEWSLSEYQQKKASRLKKNAELINLLIGYQRKQAEVAAEKQAYAELKKKYNELKEQTTTPEDRLKAVEAELAGYGPEVVEATEE